jgi:hypothetical protein
MAELKILNIKENAALLRVAKKAATRRATSDEGTDR